MKNLVPSIRPALDFEPVPRKYRYDGWTAERQRAFIAALAETGSVKAAAKRINMSAEGAYYLRRQPDADGFRAAWAEALAHGVQNLIDVAVDRAIEGVPEPIHWRGEQIGEKRRYNDRLLMFTIRHHLPERYGNPGLYPGTRSRDTIEREAAENCPVCKAKAAAAEAAANPDADELKARQAFLDRLLKQYRAKVRSERHARLQGNVVAADFTVRQLTQIELLLEASDAGRACFAIWDEEHARRCDAAARGEDGEDEGEGDATSLSHLLEQTRHAVWAKQALLRPPTSPRGGTATTAFYNGDTRDQRRAAQSEATAAMRAAQAKWEAAATEDGWARWCGEEVSSTED